MEDEHTKGPLHNNPQEAAKYVKAINLLLQSFVTDIRGFDRYKCLDAWETFLHALSQLLSKLDSAYFTKIHNHMAEVAKAIIDVSEVSSPEQFTFVLQLAVRPIIQLKIPPHLCHGLKIRVFYFFIYF